MASMAMRGPSAIRYRPQRSRGSGLGRDDFAAVVMAAGRAHVVRQLQFTTVRAFLELRRRQRMVAAAHVPLRRRGFSLRDSHAAPSKAIGTTIKIATICASSQRDNPRVAAGSSRTAAPIAERAVVARVGVGCEEDGGGVPIA